MGGRERRKTAQRRNVLRMSKERGRTSQHSQSDFYFWEPRGLGWIPLHHLPYSQVQHREQAGGQPARWSSGIAGEGSRTPVWSWTKVAIWAGEMPRQSWVPVGYQVSARQSEGPHAKERRNPPGHQIGNSRMAKGKSGGRGSRQMSCCEEMWGDELLPLVVDYLLWASVTCPLLLHFAKSGGWQLLLAAGRAGGLRRSGEGPGRGERATAPPPCGAFPGRLFRNHEAVSGVTVLCPNPPLCFSRAPSNSRLRRRVQRKRCQNRVINMCRKSIWW